jgi:hypothetical protein
MAGLRIRVLNIDVKRWFEITESTPIIPAKMNAPSPGISPHLMNTDENKAGGRINETTKA